MNEQVDPDYQHSIWVDGPGPFLDGEIITSKEAGNIKMPPSNQPFTLVKIEIAGEDIATLRSVCEVAEEYFVFCRHHGSDGDFPKETADKVKEFCDKILLGVPNP